jgi:hypothetical protein
VLKLQSCTLKAIAGPYSPAVLFLDTQLPVSIFHEDQPGKESVEMLLCMLVMDFLKGIGGFEGHCHRLL